MTSPQTATGPDLVDALLIRKGRSVLRAINHKLRQQMLQLIHQKKQLTVTEILQELQLEQSVASQHLAILRKAGLVLTTRQGKYVYYSVHYDRIEHVHRHAVSLL